MLTEQNKPCIFRNIKTRNKTGNEKMNNYDASKILGLSGELTKELIKKAYRVACSKFHPDRNTGGAEMMKAVNEAYEVLKDFEGCLNHEQANYGEDLMNVVNSLSDALDLELEICGTWLWIGGETRAHKALIKAAGCKWASKKKKWYYRPGDYKSKARGNFSMEEIREHHGSQSVKGQGRMKVNFS